MVIGFIAEVGFKFLVGPTLVGVRKVKELGLLWWFDDSFKSLAFCVVLSEDIPAKAIL